MTTPQRWKTIDEIFAAALELEPLGRPAFLTQACGSDEKLRQEVESLLAHDVPESLVGKQAVEEATQLLGPAAQPKLQNQHIGPYQVIRSLGAGAMGHVYLAHDKRLNRQVAVKLLSFYDVSQEERIRRFRREALAASALNHPNILTIYEIGEADDNHFIATEFVDGQTLHELISKGDVPAATAVDIVSQIAKALAAAHAAGIVHRDIKPANIMLRADGLVKVLDFGIAKYSQPDDTDPDKDASLLTNPGAVIGTAAYMSPEQARGNPIDPRTDIWSLGVIFYELVAGRRPFEGGTPMDLISAVLQQQPPPCSLHKSVAPELERIILKSLEKDREKRYQTATELLTKLKQLSHSLELIHEKQANPGQQHHPETVIQASQPDRTSEDRPTITSSAKYASGNFLRHKYAVGLVSLAIIIAAVTFSYYRFFQPGHSSIESVAVLPFVNDSGNSDLEYLSDGMTDSLINSLSQLPHLSVKARSSVFRYKGKELDSQRIASELSVQAILTGRVVQRGADLTLYLSLVDARTNNQLWGEQYDRKLTDIVTLQKEIALDVSNKLRVKLSGSEEQKVAKNYTANVEAYQLYLKGRFHVYKLTPPEVQQGIAYFQQAIQRDPNYALAYVGLSEAYRSLALGVEVSPTEFLPKSRDAAQKALDIDDGLPEAHTALGATIFWHDWNWNEAENQYKRGLELNPSSADTHLFYAHLLSNTGRHSEALVEIKRARELDPLNPFLNALEGQFLLHAGKTDEALARLRETFELAPGFWLPHAFASSAYIEKGMFAEAIAEAQRARELSGVQTFSFALEGYALAKLGKRDEARAVLDGLLKLSKERFVPPYHIALLYNGVGEPDHALAWLEKGYEQRDPKMAFLKVEPKWNNLRADPRFQNLMKRVGF
ncbi:MAG: protein kinase [Acidobacteriota bacterium]